MQGRETPNQQVGDSNHCFVEFLLRSIGNLMETVAALLVASF